MNAAVDLEWAHFTYLQMLPVASNGPIALPVTLQRALRSDLDKGTSFNGKDTSAPRCLARPGNAATNDKWLLSPNRWKDEQKGGRWTEVALILL